jgi:hypothetical protein
MSDIHANRPSWVMLLLILLPLGLVVSCGVAVWLYFRQEKKLAEAEQQRFSQIVSSASLADDLKKLVDVIGERNGSSETAAKNLTRTASMIEGTLGPSNTGYAVQRVQGPAEWPILRATLKGKKPELAAVWVLTSYDSRPGSPGAEANASGLAATMAAAQALAGDKMERDVNFVFLPHVNDPESPVLETAEKLKSLTNSPQILLCVEAMGAGDELWLSSRETAAKPLGLTQGLGSVRGAEVVCLGDDVDLASILFEMDLPAVRVATRPIITPAEADNQAPPATTVAAATGRLVELIRRCATLR